MNRRGFRLVIDPIALGRSGTEMHRCSAYRAETDPATSRAGEGKIPRVLGACRVPSRMCTRAPAALISAVFAQLHVTSQCGAPSNRAPAGKSSAANRSAYAYRQCDQDHPHEDSRSRPLISVKPHRIQAEAILHMRPSLAAQLEEMENPTEDKISNELKGSISARS